MGGGGSERVAAHLANAWAERGDSVTLVISFSGRAESFYPLSQRVRVLHLSDLAGRTGRGVRTYWSRFWSLRGLIRSAKFDVIVSFLPHVNIAVLIAALGLPVRVIVSERTYPPMSPLAQPWRTLRRLVYPSAHTVAVQTQESLSWLHDAIPYARGAVIPNPAIYPLADGQPTVQPQNVFPATRNLLLSVGRMNRGKQFDLLLQAFASIAPKYPGWDLAILGDGPERANLDSLIEKLDLRGRVTMPGQAGNVGAWYERADLYVLSSRFEGFPNSLAEAMAYGCAAVSYDCKTGPREIIRHEHNGLLVTEVGDVPALAAALDRLIGNERERNRMSVHALEVRERFSMPRVLSLWDGLFAGANADGVESER
jgi:GalNAc-alpha-(1->4)-GalNAc-alpha-(1->3)-diNAcBac-PP-undecaprenol alpha-1,4-N-acetyl-D-galactosaminyltransferase